MSKELDFNSGILPYPDLSMGKSPLEIEVESDIELLEAGMSPDEIARMTVSSQEILRCYSHYDLDEGDEEGVYDE